MTCYEAGRGCRCKKKESCGGVENMLTTCPQHGLAGAQELRICNCWNRGKSNEQRRTGERAQ